MTKRQPPKLLLVCVLFCYLLSLHSSLHRHPSSLSSSPCLAFLLPCANAQSDPDYEFVEELLEEEKEHFSDYDNPYYEDRDVHAKQEEYRRRVAEEEMLRQMEAERMVREQAEMKRRQREEAFEKETARMSEEEAKRARNQKKKDAKIVKRILKAAERGDHYAVLGLRNLEITIPRRSIGFGRFTFHTPGLTLFRVSDNAIRRTYRSLSRQVHPDRNRDGRAEEAFIALENSASILSDQGQRLVYDEQIRVARRRRREYATKTSLKALNGTVFATQRVFSMVHGVMGPFAFPIVVLGSLIV